MFPFWSFLGTLSQFLLSYTFEYIVVVTVTGAEVSSVIRGGRDRSAPRPLDSIYMYKLNRGRRSWRELVQHNDVKLSARPEHDQVESTAGSGQWKRYTRQCVHCLDKGEPVPGRVSLLVDWDWIHSYQWISWRKIIWDETVKYYRQAWHADTGVHMHPLSL